MLSQTFRDVLPKAKKMGEVLVHQLDDIIAQFSGLWNVQHDDDGTHGDITADSIEVDGPITSKTLQVTGPQSESDGNTVIVGRFEGQSGFDPSDLNTVSIIGKLASLIASATDDGDPSITPSAGVFLSSPDSSTAVFAHRDGGTFIAVGNTSPYLAIDSGIAERNRSVAMGDWEAYAPTWAGSVSNPAIGNGTITASFMKIGETVFVRIRVVMGSTTTFGSGVWSFSLPSTAADASNGVGSGRAFDSDANLRYVLSAVPLSTTSWAASADAAGGAVSPTSPMTWAQNDVLLLSFFYEEA